MKTFDKPTKLNGAELKAELGAIGIVVDEIFDFADGTIGFITDDEIEAAKIVKKHVGNVEAKQATIEDKLASVGLSVSDLKSALGI